MLKPSRRLSLLLLTLSLLIGIVPLQAQDDITITLVVDSFILDFLSDDVFADFEAQNPGVKVRMVGNESNPFFSPNIPVGDYLDEVEKFVSEGDVVIADGTIITPEATRAGYFLDLLPLASSDPNLDQFDFYPTLWNAYQWDGSMWGLPVSADVIGLLYNPEDFDNASVPYPETFATMTDVDFAIRQLTEYDDDGNISRNSFLDLNNNLDVLLVAMAGQGVVDDFAFPSVPDFSNPALEDALTVWADIQREGLVPLPGQGDFSLDVPMALGPSLFASFGAGNELTVSPLPGGQIGLDVVTAAVSAGTRYPQEAYELAKFITSSPELANAFFGVVPARQSLYGVDAGDNNSPLQFISPSPEIEALVLQTINQGIPPSSRRYAQFLAVAIAKVNIENLDPRSALDETETEILDRLATADERRDTVSIAVATPPPPVELAAGEVPLKFGVSAFFTPLPNEQEWEDAAQAFAEQDFEVGNVEIIPATFLGGNTLQDMSEDYDCFYMTGNIVQNADLEKILSIDPLLFSDPNLNVNDFVGNILSVMQRDNLTWGVPLTIQPQAMGYESDIIMNGGGFLPYAGWTITDFENLLRTLKIDPEDPEPFVPDGFTTGTTLLSLIASYGGLPLDYRTDPITINFTDPATVNAIQQVLDLAKNGYIKYDEQSGFGGGGAVAINGETDPVALFTEFLTGLFGGGDGFDLGEGDAQNALPGTVAFPQGTTLSALVYDVGGAYISSNTQFAEACYRFISSLTQRPTLLSSMPTLRTQISNPELAITQGDANVTLYNDLDVLLQNPNTIAIPSPLSTQIDSASDALLTFWLNRAFDRYILEDADLPTELEEAELFSRGYQECTAQLPPFDPDTNSIFDYAGEFIGCATQVDPSTEELFGGFGGN